MKILIRSLLGAFILNFLMSLGVLGASDAPAKKTVLALFPYQNDVPYSVLAMQTIKDEFDSAHDLSLDLYYEYLDLNRFPGKDYQQQILSLYTTKYGHKSIDLVIVASEVVLNFWLEHRTKIAPNPPVVFCDVQTERLATLQLPPDVTGVSGALNHVQSVEWLLRALPGVKEIVTVRGVGAMDRRDIQALDTLQEAFLGRVTFSDLSDLPLVEIKRRVAALPRSSVVVYHLMFEDAAGKRYRPVDALRELAAASAVPVIGGFDHYIGFGTVGGYMYSMEQQTRQASQMGLSILRGKPVSAIPIAKDQSNRFIFDHLALQRYDIPLSVLPPDCIIKNRQYSAWERYKSQIISITAIFIVLLLLIAFLIVLMRRLNTAQFALKHLNANLETQVQERTADLGQTNRHLELEMVERKRVEEMLRGSEKKFRSIVESSPFAMYFYRLESDQRLVLTGANPAADRIIGIPHQALIGKTIEEAFPNLADTDIPDMYRKIALDSLVTQDFEISYRDDRLSGLYAVTVFKTDERAIAVNFVDISERKQAEDALKRKQEEARRLAKEKETVAELGRIISSNINIEEVYGHFAEKVKQVISFDRLSVNVINRTEGEVTVAYAAGLPVPWRQPGDVFSLAGSTNELVVTKRYGLIIQPKNEEEIDRLFT